MNVAWAIIGGISLSIIIVAAVYTIEDARGKRPNYWRKNNATSPRPDPSCNRFPDWKINSPRERR